MAPDSQPNQYLTISVPHLYGTTVSAERLSVNWANLRGRLKKVGSRAEQSGACRAKWCVQDEDEDVEMKMAMEMWR